MVKLKQLNWLQKQRLLQAVFAFIVCGLSFTFVRTFSLPDPPPIEAFLTNNEIVRYNLLQLIFFLSFVCMAAFLGMAYQAKDIQE